jgi:hypothetical protein
MAAEANVQRHDKVTNFPQFAPEQAVTRRDKTLQVPQKQLVSGP